MKRELSNNSTYIQKKNKIIDEKFSLTGDLFDKNKRLQLDDEQDFKSILNIWNICIFIKKLDKKLRRIIEN